MAAQHRNHRPNRANQFRDTPRLSRRRRLLNATNASNGASRWQPDAPYEVAMPTESVRFDQRYQAHTAS